MNERDVAKEFLRQFKTATMRLEAMENLISELEEELDNIKANYENMPRGSEISDKTGNLASKLADYHMEAIELRSEAWDKRMEIERLIIGLCKDEARVLSLRYIYDKTFEQVAVETNLPWRTMWRVYNRALDNVGNILFEE